jgi:lysophospholipase L1-like esterase
MKNISCLRSASRLSVKHAVLLVVLVACTLWPADTSWAANGLWTYTGLGDSLAFGAFALPGQGYVPRYAGYLQTDLSRPIFLFPLGIPGWTSSELLHALRTNSLFRSSVFLSNVVTWNVGGNDLNSARNRYKDKNCGGADNQQCFRDAVSTFKANWTGIIDEIFALRRFRKTVIRTMDIYNPFVREDLASDTWPGDAGNDFQAVNAYLDEVNAFIASTAMERKIAFAPVHLAFNGPNGTDDPGDKGLLAFDHFHPNTVGHILIAQLLRGVGYSQTTP